ncbi:hypothetical protein [Roseateles saccharophilus]|uniref:Uncharacterized protein n=1 Tax=Roseateles saccharophilus TaxID=304 RepID=A0A4R3UIH7_ROSSA|nr:hypothetical protein [Roseateles saccharophilus]MDG0834437.1 hypothetical protein [Roseateles saccharophilus]TCU89851.1 hypothetical protein EV671_103230 [Roseateles saccharophilus]
MGCCGQGRAALRQAPSPTPERPAAGPAERRVLVRYRASSPVVVRGVASGRLYEFDAGRPTLYVSEGDAAALLRSRWFIRAD